MKKFLVVIFLGLLGVGGYFGYQWYMNTNLESDVYAFVPDDFVFVIESDEPVNDWRSLSASPTWKVLKTSPYFADISKKANTLDSLLNKNQKLTELAKLGKLLISTHTIAKDNYDFLLLLDLQDKGKLSSFTSVLPPLFAKMGYKVSTIQQNNYTIYKLLDTQTRDVLSISLVNNVLVASYTANLVHNAIQHLQAEPFLNADKFKQIYQKVNQNVNYSMMVNYHYMDNFIKIFTPQPPEMLMGLGATVASSGFSLNTTKEGANFDGYTQQIDSIASYLTIFNASGTGEIHAQNILPASTAMFTSVGFSDFKKFYGEIMQKYQKENPKEYDDLQQKVHLVEKLLNISIEKDFFSWLDDEIITAIIPVPDSATQENHFTYYAMLHFDENNYEGAKAGLDHIARQVKRRTPFKFEKEDYKGFEIRYLGAKDMFEIFFKKLLGKIEKPHYIFLDDYVVFSNDVNSLKYLIDEYLKENILRNSNPYKQFSPQFSKESNIYTYIQMQYFYPYLLASLSPESQKTMKENESAVKAFQQVGFQMIPEGGMFKTILHTEVKEQQK